MAPADRASLALLLAQASPQERSALLTQHQHLADCLLAHLLKARYLDTISSDPLQAANSAAALVELAATQDDPEIHALADWTSGMAALQIEGRIEPAITLIDAAAARFEAIGQPQQAAATQASKVYALALLGRYDESIRSGERARDTLLRYGDTLTAGKIEQNLGNIHHRRDRYAEAEHSYRAARELFLQAGDQRLLAYAENGLANVLALQHEVRAAADLYEQALGRAVAVGAEVTRAEIECNLGCLALFQGRYDRALDFLERSRRRYAALNMPHQSILAELELADAYLELNLVSEAADSYARIVPALVELGMRAEQARACANYGRACVACGRLDEAHELIAEAQILYRAEGNQVGAALAALTGAHLACASGDYELAASVAMHAEAVLASVGARSQQLLAGWLRADALRAAGHTDQARQLLDSTLRAAYESDIPQIVQRCLTSIGLLAVADGEFEVAEEALTQAITLIEELRAPLPGELFRAAFIADKLAAYSQLARLLLEQGRVAEALDTVERARARALLETMRGETQTQPAPGDTTEAELLARLEALREELNWCYSQLNRLPDGDGPRDPAGISGLEQATRRREALIQQMSRQLQQHGRVPPALGAPFDLAGLQEMLGAETAVVEYACLDGEVLAFVITDQRVEVVRRLAHEDQVSTALTQFSFQIRSLRHGAQLLRAHGDQLARRTQQHLRTLYELLLEPIEQHLGIRQLVVVPDRALHYIPFHALYDGTHYVIERREVSYAPSAEVFRYCASRPRGPLAQALLLGVADDRTPRLQGEVEALAPLFASATTLTNDRATLAALHAYAPSANILHLACHAYFRPDNPLFSALQLADGRLTVRDAYALEMHCELAVLSACETGISAVAPGDELLGLTRGFFVAGTPALVVSLWAVDDESTAMLMTHFYERLLAGASPAAALQAAQCALMERYAHPFFWSPFIVIGRK